PARVAVVSVNAVARVGLLQQKIEEKTLFAPYRVDAG
ncbi:hypothetical protein PC118_g19821, partial [Phytophthora cactorum]